MGIRLIDPPTAEVITLAQIKKDLRVDHSDEDATLTSMMAEATDNMERRLSLKLMLQTWEYIIDYFPADEIRLPFGPVQSIVQVAYDHADTAIETILPATDYTLDDVSYRVNPEPWLFPTVAWPATFAAINAVRIRFIAGHESAERVPASIRAAWRLKVRELYDGNDTSNAIDRLLEQYDLLVA